MALVKFKKGKKANLPTENQEGTIYVTTDDKKLHIDTGTSKNDRITFSDDTYAKKQFAARSSPNSTAESTVEFAKYLLKEGDDINISSAELNDDKGHNNVYLWTSEKIWEEFKDAYIDVEATTSEDEDKKRNTVLKFTNKNGDTKTVTIADIFLSNAVYYPATHTLTLTLNDGSTTDIDLSDLIGNSLSDVKVDSEEKFTVQLGTGVTLGGFKTGDTIAENMTVEQIVKKLLTKQVPPTYTQPSVSIANNGGSSAGSYEAGTLITPKLKATFAQNDAGTLTYIQFKKNGGNVTTLKQGEYTETAFTLTINITYTAVATYGEGPIKKDNLGDDYPTGRIAAGTKTSNNYTFTPFRKGYFAGYTTDTNALTSDVIRSLGVQKNSAYSSGNFTFTVAEGAKRVVIACPATNTGVTKIINTSALNADVTSAFAKTTVNVEGANGYSAIAYNVWTYTPDVPYTQDAVLTVALG